jgi:hypothetical protein
MEKKMKGREMTSTNPICSLLASEFQQFGEAGENVNSRREKTKKASEA